MREKVDKCDTKLISSCNITTQFCKINSDKQFCLINSDKQFCLINSDKQFCMINSDKKDPKLYDLLQDMREKETHGRFHYLCYP